MRPLTAIFAAAAVALPWYWAVGLATHGEFLRTFFLEHNLGRATGTMEHHSGTIFFYPLTILVGFFPWSVFAVPLAIDTALQLRRRDRFHPGYLLAVCWIGVYVVLFSLARTKLPSYVTPCYPALALLVGDYIDRWSRQSAAVAGPWLTAAFACLALVGVAIAVAVPLIARRLLPGEEWLGLIGLIPLAGGVVCMGLTTVRSFQAAAATFALSATAFTATLFAIGTDRVDRHQQNHQLWQAIYSQSVQPQIASYRILEPSWVYYSESPIHEFTARNAAESWVAAEQASQFLIANHDAFLITTQQRVGEISALLPPDIRVIQSAPYFLKEGQQLVVLGRLNHDFGPPGHRHAATMAIPDLH
jgi:4-amino-4-deoxy-L-arabinose transferase-like glycosyltransferase